VLGQRSEGEALQAVAVMHQGLVVDMDAALALQAARISVDSGLPMADSVILVTARAHNATLWTQVLRLRRCRKRQVRSEEVSTGRCLARPLGEHEPKTQMVVEVARPVNNR
jgi:hypothetical protein